MLLCALSFALVTEFGPVVHAFKDPFPKKVRNILPEFFLVLSGNRFAVGELCMKVIRVALIKTNPHKEAALPVSPEIGFGFSIR